MASDEDGFLGRECPNKDCLGYFKIQPGTGLAGDNLPCHCPYCGHTDTHDHFWTQDQIEYAKSIAMRKVQEQIFGMLRDSFKPLPSSRKGFLSISWELRPGAPIPLHQYTEETLETILVCDHCKLRYAVYGVFAYCPDCRTHNSFQILSSNLDLALKMLELAATVSEPLAGQLVSDALENAVATFDAFGREYLRTNADLSSSPEQAAALSGQNPERLRTQVQKLFDVEIASGFGVDEWETLVRAFQKRHLIAHKMGVIDEVYIKATRDRMAMKGRKVTITPEEVQKFIPLVLRLGKHIHASIAAKRHQGRS